MSINLELSYLSTFGYIDEENIMRFRKKTRLNPAETTALQKYASWTSHWENTENRKGGFTNQNTYRLIIEAEECKWYECFTPRELEEIKQFLKKYGYQEVLEEIPEN